MTNKHTFTSTTEKRSSSAPTYTTQPMATPYGWQGDKPTRYTSSGQAPPRSQFSPTEDIGRVSDFMQGVKESRDQRAKTAAIMVGTYVGIKAAQHWSAWRRQQGRR